MARKGFYTMSDGEKKYYSYLEDRKHIYPADIKFEPVQYSRDVDKISEERYNELIDMVKAFNCLFAKNKAVSIDNIKDFSLGEKYSYILRILNNDLDRLFLISDSNVEFKNDAEKHLLINLFADPSNKYLEYYNLLRKDLKDSMEVAKCLNQTCGFYSNKLLMLELRHEKLLLNIASKHLEEEASIGDGQTTKK